MKLKHLVPLLVTMLLPATALAHIGNHAGIHHGSAFIMGLAHPYTGLDHRPACLPCSAGRACGVQIRPLYGLLR